MTIAINRTREIDGVPVSFRRSIAGWVAVLGEDYAITLRQVGMAWVAKKTRTPEPIATAPTMEEAFRLAKCQYDAMIAETKERVARRLAAAGYNQEKING
jgi:hypothetical protein